MTHDLDTEPHDRPESLTPTDGLISVMHGVRGGERGFPVELWRKDGRLLIRSYNESGYNFTEVDLWDMVGWLQHTEPRDRPDEIEMTPEMIAAGVSTYALFDSGDRASVVVESIYAAMEAAKPSVRPDTPENREALVWVLARRLHWKMEHLDPTDEPKWEALTDHQRHFYFWCVKDLLSELRAYKAERPFWLTCPCAMEAAHPSAAPRSASPDQINQAGPDASEHRPLTIRETHG